MRFTLGDAIPAAVAAAREDPAWRYRELPVGHDGMITDPCLLADLLLDLVR